MMPDITMHHDESHHHTFSRLESRSYIMREANGLISGRPRNTVINHQVTNDDSPYIRDGRHQGGHRIDCYPNERRCSMNALIGSTTSNMPWNPIYFKMMGVPDSLNECRLSIAHHGAGHALIEAIGGKRDHSLRMPSFSDTPHVVIASKEELHSSCDTTVEAKLRKLCDLFGGYMAEYRLNQGEYRDIAAFCDYEEAIDLADEIAASTGWCAPKLLLSVARTVDLVQSQHLDVLEDLAHQLICEGFVSSRDFAYLVRGVKEQDLAPLVVQALNSPDFTRWSETYERMFF